MHMTRRDWSVGAWTHPPVSTHRDGDHLLVEAVEASDAWRHTSYGFVHDSEHALVAPLADGEATEVAFVAAFTEQFDQAGVFVGVDDETWIKAGVEFADGAPQVGAVVTHGSSDWSVAPVPEWDGRVVRVRASRSGDAVTIRAGIDGEPLRLVRVAPFPVGADVVAGPLCCAPSRAGLIVRFTEWSVGPADASLH